MSFVLDASVTLAWAFEDEGGDYAVAVLEALRTGEAFVAHLWGLEVANGLLAAERRGRIVSGARPASPHAFWTYRSRWNPLPERGTFDACTASPGPEGLRRTTRPPWSSP